MSSKPEENAKVEAVSQPDQPCTRAPESSSTPPSESEEDTKKWGTHIMGPPSAPAAHPDNQKAALWSANEQQQIYELPYLVYSPAEKPTNNPLEPVINMFNTWSTKAETVARNIWHNRKLIYICKLLKFNLHDQIFTIKWNYS